MNSIEKSVHVLKSAKQWMKDGHKLMAVEVLLRGGYSYEFAVNFFNGVVGWED